MKRDTSDKNAWYDMNLTFHSDDGLGQQMVLKCGQS
jgi:hypothetical protein